MASIRSIIRLVETPPRYPPYTGGVENVAQAICRRLVAGGDEILVICADDPPGASDVGDGVPIRRLRSVFKVANTNITPSLPVHLLRERYDVIHTHIPTPWSAEWSVLLGRLRGRGTVVTFHNEIVGSGMNGFVAHLYRATLFRVTLALADRIIVLSDYWRDELASSLGESVAGKITVIPNGVDLTRFRPGMGGNGHQLLFVGVLDRFHRYKGLDVLLEALSLVEDDFELTVVGDGDLRHDYERMSISLGLRERVHFVGRVSDDELVRQYHEADVYILPSDFARQEGGFTLTALEAMACGCAAILADGSGQIAVEVEKFGAGLRAPAGDKERLADAIRLMLRDEAQRQQMRSAAREFVEVRHSWDDNAVRRRAVYMEAESEGARRRHRRTHSEATLEVGTGQVHE